MTDVESGAKMKIAFYILSLLPLLACTNKEMYESTQINNRIECTQLPPSEYKECMERNNMSYDEYERQRQELLHPDNKN